MNNGHPGSSPGCPFDVSGICASYGIGTGQSGSGPKAATCSLRMRGRRPRLGDILVNILRVGPWAGIRAMLLWVGLDWPNRTPAELTPRRIGREGKWFATFVSHGEEARILAAWRSCLSFGRKGTSWIRS